MGASEQASIGTSVKHFPLRFKPILPSRRLWDDEEVENEGENRKGGDPLKSSPIPDVIG